MPVVTFKAWPQPELWNHTFQVTRMLGLIDFGGADFTEIYQAIHRIDPGDDESWHKEWFRLGLLAEDQAHEAERAGNPLSIRYAYQRASNYYRASQFYMPGSDNRPSAAIVRSSSSGPVAHRKKDKRVARSRSLKR